MSSVDSLRARFAREEHDRQVANRAALKGAVLAFPKQNGQTVKTTSTTTKPVSGASAAASKTWQTNATVHPPRPPTKILGLAAASTGAVRAHQKSQENLLLHQDQDTISRTSSPSLTAASIAAAHHKQQHAAAPVSKLSRPPVQFRPIASRHEEEDSKDTDKLPEPGTVKDVRQWLQALEGTVAEERRAVDVSARRPSGESLSAAQTSYRTPPIKPTRPQTSAKMESTQRSSTPVIHSPRPLRAVSAASSIDAIAQRDAAQEAASRRPPIPKKDVRLRSTSFTPEPEGSRRPLPPARKPSVRSQDAGSHHILEKETRPKLPTRKPTVTSPEPVWYDTEETLTRTNSNKPAAPPARRSRPRTTTEPESLPPTKPTRPTNIDEISTQPPTKPPRPTSRTQQQRPALSSRTHSNSTVTRATTPTPSLPPRPSMDATSTAPSSVPRTTRSPAPSTFTPPKHRSSLDLPHSNPNLPMRRVSPSLSTSNLANAIVASSLASSRAPSPTKLDGPTPSLPPRPPGHPHNKLALPFHHRASLDISRTPSPAKTVRHHPTKPLGMRKTLREDTSSDSDSGDMRIRKGPKKYLRKHPNKHHEGSRKRWVDAIAEEERKRYEGVWAANRSLLLPPGPEFKDCVHGYVVRDIWSRSRLPEYVLEEVWELVAGLGSGSGNQAEKEKPYLERVEFVVGLWLIDQRLKGRKLPVRVGASVWESARGIGGVKVPGYR